jgi:hypothetical protein
MDVKQQIEQFQIPKATVAAIAGCQPAAVSRYLRDRTWVNAHCAGRIEEAVRDVVGVLESVKSIQAELAGQVIPMPTPDLRDVKALRQLITVNRGTQVERQREIKAETSAHDACHALADALPTPR